VANDTIDSAGPHGGYGTEFGIPDPKRWLALAVILVAGFMDLLDSTIVNVAIPSMQRDLNAQYSDLEWIVAAYAIAFAAMLITGGRLGDIFGRKRLFLLGVGGFTIASTLCGVAPSPGLLILARFLQGVMAALMVPQILSIIHVTFPPSERGKVFGMFGGIVGSAAVAGHIFGGLLVQWNVFSLEWRPIFLVNIPVGLAALVAGAIYIRESHSPTAPRLDIVGVAIAVVGILMIVYPLTEGRTLGWPWWSYALMVGAIPLFAVFWAFEKRRTERVGSPLVVLSLFKVRSFDAGLLVYLLFNIALGGFFLVWTLYMQIGLGWTPVHAGLTAVSFAFGAAPAAGLSVQLLTPRFGRRVLMVGALLNAAGFGGYIWCSNHYGMGISSWQMIIPLVVAGMGFGMVVAPVADVVLSAVPREDAGSASGLFSTAQQLGLALGVALIGVLFFAQLAGNAGHAVDQTTPKLRTQLTAAHVPGPVQDQITAGYRTCVTDRSSAPDPTATPASCQALAGQSIRLSPELAARVARDVTDAGRQANGKNFAHAFDASLWLAIAILILVFLGMFALPRQVRVLPEGELATVG
jgi:EmrB/QacA subfamily drug resistance transporter